MDKPGYKTTEFWLATIAAILGILAGSGVFGTTSAVGQAIAYAITGLATFGYSASRAKSKFGGSLERSNAGKPQAPSEPE